MRVGHPGLPTTTGGVLPKARDGTLSVAKDSMIRVLSTLAPRARGIRRSLAESGAGVESVQVDDLHISAGRLRLANFVVEQLAE